MNTIHFSPNKQEPTTSSTRPSRRILSPAKIGSSRVLEKTGNKELQLPHQEQLSVDGSFSSPRQHVSDGIHVGDKEKDISNGRERLKRHREEVAGHVRIPDKWSQENFLKDWMDYSSFDKLLAPKGFALAREALMADGRRGSSQRLRIESRC